MRIGMSAPVSVRLCMICENVPGSLGRITTFLGDKGINIESQVSRSKGERGYEVIDVSCTDERLISELIDEIKAIRGVLTCDVGSFSKCEELGFLEAPLRLCIVNKNVPGVIGRLANEFAKHGLNILSQINKSRGELAFTVVDLENSPRDVESARQLIEKVDGVLSVDIGAFSPSSLFGVRSDAENDLYTTIGSRSMASSDAESELLFLDQYETDSSKSTSCTVSTPKTGESFFESGEPLTRKQPAILSSKAVNNFANANDFSRLGSTSRSISSMSSSSTHMSSTDSTSSAGANVNNDSITTPIDSDVKPKSAKLNGKSSQLSVDTTLPENGSLEADCSSDKRNAIKAAPSRDDRSQNYYDGDQQEISSRKKKLNVMQEREGFSRKMNKLVFAMVGLPARGKSFIARKLERFLRWKTYNVRIYNAGKYRRAVDQTNSKADTFKNDNPDGQNLRQLAAERAMDDMYYFLCNGGEIGIFDATNSVKSRRDRIMERFHGIANVVFLEVICDDEEILEENLIIKVRNSPDFEGMSLEEALADLRLRIKNYEDVYQPLNDDRMSYIKLYNLSSKILANKVYGRITSSIIPYLVSLHVGSRPIWLVRAGLSKDNYLVSRSEAVSPDASKVHNIRYKARADSDDDDEEKDPYYFPKNLNNTHALSEASSLHSSGAEFARKLAQFLETALWMRQSNELMDTDRFIKEQVGEEISGEIVDEELDPEIITKPRANSSTTAVRLGSGCQADKTIPLKVLCSTLQRAEETAAIALESFPGGFYETRPLLNPLNKGKFNGLSIDAIRKDYPDFIEQWEQNPFYKRFPGGESYCDMINKLESILIEVEQQTAPVLIVSHLSVIQILLAYYLNIPVTESMDIEVPLHTVIELQPQYGGGWKQVNYPLLPEAATTPLSVLEKTYSSACLYHHSHK